MDAKRLDRRYGEEAYDHAGEGTPLVDSSRKRSLRWKSTLQSLLSSLKVRLALFSMSLLLLILLVRLLIPIPNAVIFSNDCSSGRKGYQCYPETSHFWGQYSPFFSLERESRISNAVPPNCKITFVQTISRHGARYPTTHKGEKYAELIGRIHQTATAYKGAFSVLKDYNINLGSNDLTTYGQQQMVESGRKFYDRYKYLARDTVPFVRAAGSDRVVASGEFFNKGFQAAKDLDSRSNKTQQSPIVNVVIPEGREWNNTLDAGTCPLFKGSSAQAAQKEFLNVFAPSILKKIKKGLPGAKLKKKDVPRLMDLCPFETVAQNNTNKLSTLCKLFTRSEWQSYDYYNTLGKYYGYGDGNHLGPTQGVGFVNEVIARMMQSPVSDYTSVNHTLDSDPATFPLNAVLYADFSHDNTITSIYYAFGLYNYTTKLPTNQAQSVAKTHGYSSSWTVPFGSRAYIEMMQCSNPWQDSTNGEPLVRMLVNDRVVPLGGCKVDSLGRCRRNDWIKGLEFARNGGNWGSC
ncbi:phytase [Talaromyces proteolyticus]|uniref:Phytase A n=1 Tax=Talaromyces proteolyticus TaxID=1131652 RepID=A0AAD4KUD9_9EURO|nr:phytase [Talaromyces proteolyticus]KAH8700194.1 phytase [Talaromyces proteolyticus]